MIPLELALSLWWSSPLFLHCCCPSCEMGWVSMCGGWQLAAGKCCSYRMVFNAIALPCFLSVCLWAPLPSCCKDFSSQRFSWEVFKLLFWELVNTQHSANVSLCEHVVKMQYICSQRLATGSKTKTVHNGEGKFRNYMLDLLLLLLVSSPMFNAEKRKEISLS